VKDLPGYLLYRLLAGLFGLLPEPVMRRVGEVLGRAGSYVARRKFELVRGHLERVIGTAPDLDERARDMFASYGRYWAEVFWVRPRRKAEIVAHAQVDGLEHVHAAQEAGAGIILALPHLGNWEAAGAKAEEIGIPVLAVAEALPNRRLIDWFLSVRRRLGIDVVIAGRGRRVTGALITRLRAGETIALLSDRDLTGRGLEVEFFGERTTIPAGPVALADRTGAALLPVGCYFKEGRGHRFVVYERVAIPAADARDERLTLGAQQFAKVMEDVIRAAPEQWHLFQPNWPSDTPTEPQA
jgi:lauroyl/myristoyl acyltransferase